MSSGRAQLQRFGTKLMSFRPGPQTLQAFAKTSVPPSAECSNFKRTQVQESRRERCTSLEGGGGFSS